MPKKKIAFPSEEEIEYEWDKKRIAIALSILVFLGAGFLAFKFFLLPKASRVGAVGGTAVQGASIGGFTGLSQDNSNNTPSQNISLPTAGGVQQQVEAIKQEVTHLNVNDIASSSPQIQQLIQQIQQLPQQPANQVKDACIRLCNNL